MRKFLIPLAMSAVVMSAPVQAKKTPELSGLALQQLQSREFEGDKDMVFASVMSVLQDSGYRIQAADKDTGLITGIASTKSKMTYNLFIGFGRSKKSPIVSAFIENRAPGVSSVRLSFVMAKVKSSLYGSAPQDEEPIYDASVYKDAFEKIDQALFIRKGMAAPVPATASAPVGATSGSNTPAVVPASTNK